MVFDLKIEGGGLVALTHLPHGDFLQVSSMEFCGIDLPTTGPDDSTPDRSVLTQLISGIRAIALRDDPNEERVAKFEEWKDLVMRDFLTIPEEKLHMPKLAIFWRDDEIDGKEFRMSLSTGNWNSGASKE